MRGPVVLMTGDPLEFYQGAQVVGTGRTARTAPAGALPVPHRLGRLPPACLVTTERSRRHPLEAII